MKSYIQKLDSRSRIALGKLKDKLAPIYKIYTEGKKIILEPIEEVPEEIHWLLKPENKHILEKLKKALKSKKYHDLGSFQDYV